MADINKSAIKLMQSQRLDDTDQGGGQMTSNEVVDGAVNNFFPDISRLDRVYGRVSMRKGFLAVQTTERQTYYGSHTVLTRQAADPNVSVCFFSSEDWFDTRDSARDRIESYLVKGPRISMSLWGNHYKGSSILKYYTGKGWDIPEVGDVLVLVQGTTEQYVRITDISSSDQDFEYNGGTNQVTYYRQVVDIEIGSQLETDFTGEEMEYVWSLADDETKTYETVAADASKYYGVSTLVEDIEKDDLQLRVDSIFAHLVPSAQSETPITDAGVGSSVSPMIQTQDPYVNTTRSLTYNFIANGSLYIGEGFVPGTFSWTGGVTLADDSRGNILNGTTTVGSVDYTTGKITFASSISFSGSGTGSATYVPACAPTQVSETGGIQIETNNRGFSYVFSCDPIPEPGTLKIDYLASGKWYSIWDQGDGQLAYSISGVVDSSLGTGTLNFLTGSVAMTLGAMPDVGSQIILYWAKPTEYYDLSGETLSLRYKFSTQNTGVNRNTFEMIWTGDGNGPGPDGEYGIVDDGNSLLMRALWSEALGWYASTEELGEIKYATGEIDTYISASQYPPVSSEVFTINYNYGDPQVDSFFAPARDVNGHITVNLTNTPILPGTFKIEWHNDIVEYDPETRFDPTRDPTYIFVDNGVGYFKNDTNDGTTNWIRGTVNYTTGAVTFHPDRTTVFPQAVYKWKVTEWHHPGVTESRVFDHITYLPTMSTFPAEGTVTCTYCTTDGGSSDSYTGTISPIFVVQESKALEIEPGGLRVSDANGTLMIDGTDGRLYTNSNGVDGTRVQVGTINYAEKSFTIISDNIDIERMTVRQCVGTAQIEPKMSLVFRTPGAPLQSGSLIVRGTNSQGDIIEGSSDFSGVISGDGIYGTVDFDTGLCQVTFGEWVVDDATAQASDWYSATASDGAGNVWKPYMVNAKTITINCVITSYLPLDPDLLGLDPVRLPLDGKVPIFRDGYIILIHNSTEHYCANPLSINDPLTSDVTENCGRTNVDLLEVYSIPTQYQLDNGTQTCPVLVPETDNYTVDLTTGNVTFLTGFSLIRDVEGTPNQLIILSRIEDLCLASDVQVTGHISVTSPITHDYTLGVTQVSSVLPSADLQSRAYNEFEMASWPGWTSSRPSNISEPLASYNFVDYPITVTNMPSIKERWALIFSNTTQVDVVGENMGVLLDNVTVIGHAEDGGDLDVWDGTSSGVYRYGGQPFLIVANRRFSGNPYDNAYWMINCNGFGLGWASGNVIRFDQDAANFPLWFVRTTLQAPVTEPVDYYTIQIRGDSS